MAIDIINCTHAFLIQKIISNLINNKDFTYVFIKLCNILPSQNPNRSMHSLAMKSLGTVDKKTTATSVQIQTL